MVKRSLICTGILLIISTFVLFAQNSKKGAGKEARQIIENMQQKLLQEIDNGTVISFDFDGSVKEQPESAITFTGDIICYKESYILDGPGLDIYCDGKSKWIWNEDADEITIFPHNPEDENILENPIAFIYMLDDFENFAFQHGKTTYRDGSSTRRVIIKTIGKKEAFHFVNILLDESTFLPINIELYTDEKTCYIIKFNKFDSIPAGFDFSFKPSDTILNDPNTIITDMRS